MVGDTRIDRALNLVVGCDLAQRHHIHFNRRLPTVSDSATLIPARPVRRCHYFRPTGPRRFPLRNQRTSAELARALGITILLTNGPNSVASSASGTSVASSCTANRSIKIGRPISIAPSTEPASMCETRLQHVQAPATRELDLSRGLILGFRFSLD